MKIIQKTVTVNNSVEYHSKHLQLINPFLPVELSPKEREILGTFMSFKGELAEKERFGTSYRKEVKNLLSMSDGNLTNHISSLRLKGAIVENPQGTLYIPSFLFPEQEKQFYQFKVVYNESNP